MSARTTTGGAKGKPARVTVEVIGFGKRLMAAIVDSLIILMITFALTIVIGMLSILVSSFNPDKDLPIGQLTALLGALMAILYYIRFWSKTGQTIGMSTFGMRVVDKDGGSLTTGRAITRFLGYIVSAVVMSLGFLWIAIDKRNQGWHDKIAGTFVVDVDDLYEPGTATEFVGSPEGRGWIWIALWLLIALVAPAGLFAGLLVFGPVLDRVISQFLRGLLG